MNNRRKQLMLASAREYCKCVVEGKTLKYNQLIVNGNFASSSGWNITNASNITFSNNVLSCKNTNTTYAVAFDMQTTINFTTNHKYLIRFLYNFDANIGNDLATGFTGFQTAQTFTCDGKWHTKTILAIGNGVDYHMYIRPTASTGNTLMLSNYIIIDLTLLGLDNVNSFAEFYSTDLGKYIAKGNYLPYEPNGKFIHAQSPINFEGVNIWNEQYRGGCYDTPTGDYNSFSSDVELCSKDKIRVKPNTKYYVYCGKQDIENFAFFYDKNNNYLGYRFYIANSLYDEFMIITPNNAYYMNITFGTDYGTTYLHDICISENVWNENYEIGYIDGNGIFHSGEGIDRVCSKDLIKLESGTYITNKTVYVYVYDKNGNFIEEQDTWNANTTRKFASTTYIKITGTTTETTYSNDIAIFYYGYQKYCGNKTYNEPLTYNQLVLNGNFASTEGWSLNGCTLSVLNNVATLTITANANSNGIETGIQLGGYAHRYALVFNASASRPTIMRFSLGGSSIAGIEEYIHTTEEQFKFIFYSDGDSINTLRMFVNANNLFLQNGDKVYLSNFMVIDLTKLYGAGNEPTSVNELNETDVGKAIDNGEYLPYSVSNDTYYIGGWDMYKGCVWKSWNGQLTKTMSLINLDNLSWVSDENGMVAQLPSNFKTFEYDELASVIAEKYETAKYDDEIPDSICISNLYGYGYSVVIRYSSTQPSGFALFELATPTTENVTTRMVSRRTINVESENGIDLDFTKE